MNSKPKVDPRVVESHELALSALAEITPESTIGPFAGYVLESDDVVSLRFENRLGGYPGWHWTVSLTSVDGAEPTVLEVELLPGDSALLAPEWVPWATRLAEYHAVQKQAKEAGEEDDDDDDVDVDDIDGDDSDDDEVGGAARLHSGDVDGVDIDELDTDSGDDAADEGSDDESRESADGDDSDDSDDDDSDDEDSVDDEDSDDEESTNAPAGDSDSDN